MNLKAQSNSKSGHKNISYYEEEHSYIVSVYRDGKKFKTRVNTLEEAIQVRDQSLEFYEEHGHLPTRFDLNIENRKYRRLKIREKKVLPVCICEMCKSKMSYVSNSSIEKFKDRGNICGHCQSKDRNRFSLEAQSHKQNRLNEKYISKIVADGCRTYYAVHLDKDRASLCRTFKTLQDAIDYRNQMLDFYKENNRMPNEAELISLFGLRPSNRKISNEPSDSKNSSTGLKNIIFEPTKGRYHVNIIRNRIKCEITFKTLEDAKLARQIILNTFDQTGVMLRSGEVRAKMKELKEHEILKSTETFN